MSFDSALQVDLDRFLISIRRHLHTYPEVGLEEHETYAFIREVLEQHGLEVRGPVAGTGLYVDIKGTRPGPTIAYRADIDALPIQDCKKVEYASTRAGVAHLCGHDAHATIAIGTAMLLHQRRDEIEGTIRVLFQPNEESSPSGAVMMIRDGILDDVEAIYAAHMDPGLDAGRFGLIVGPATAAADRFRMTISAETTGHSARPHEAVDTVWAAVQISNALYQLIGRVTDPRNATVLTICRFHGGDAYNVIPDHVDFGGTVRSTSLDDRVAIHHQMRATAERIGAMCGATVNVQFDQGVPAVINDDRMIENAAHAIEEEFGSQAIYRIPLPSMGGEDFAHYLQHVPGALLRVGSRSGPETAHPLHDARFDIDESSLATAACLMSTVLLRHLRYDVTGEPDID